MNENLKALLDQALDASKFPGREPIQLDNGHFSFTEKLAELIVRECIKVCQEHSITENASQNSTAETLKSHFGFSKPPTPPKR